MVNDDEDLSKRILNLFQKLLIPPPLKYQKNWIDEMSYTIQNLQTKFEAGLFLLSNNTGIALSELTFNDEEEDRLSLPECILICLFRLLYFQIHHADDENNNEEVEHYEFENMHDVLRADDRKTKDTIDDDIDVLLLSLCELLNHFYLYFAASPHKKMKQYIESQLHQLLISAEEKGAAQANKKNHFVHNNSAPCAWIDYVHQHFDILQTEQNQNQVQDTMRHHVDNEPIIETAKAEIMTTEQSINRSSPLISNDSSDDNYDCQSFPFQHLYSRSNQYTEQQIITAVSPLKDNEPIMMNTKYANEIMKIEQNLFSCLHYFNTCTHTKQHHHNHNKNTVSVSGDEVLYRTLFSIQHFHENILVEIMKSPSSMTEVTLLVKKSILLMLDILEHVQLKCRHNDNGNKDDEITLNTEKIGLRILQSIELFLQQHHRQRQRKQNKTHVDEESSFSLLWRIHFTLITTIKPKNNPPSSTYSILTLMSWNISLENIPFLLSSYIFCSSERLNECTQYVSSILHHLLKDTYDKSRGGHCYPPFLWNIEPFVGPTTPTYDGSNSDNNKKKNKIPEDIMDNLPSLLLAIQFLHKVMTQLQQQQNVNTQFTIISSSSTTTTKNRSSHDNNSPHKNIRIIPIQIPDILAHFIIMCGISTTVPICQLANPHFLYQSCFPWAKQLLLTKGKKQVLSLEEYQHMKEDIQNKLFCALPLLISSVNDRNKEQMDNEVQESHSPSSLSSKEAIEWCTQTCQILNDISSYILSSVSSSSHEIISNYISVCVYVWICCSIVCSSHSPHGQKEATASPQELERKSQRLLNNILLHPTSNSEYKVMVLECLADLLDNKNVTEKDCSSPHSCSSKLSYKSTRTSTNTTFSYYLFAPLSLRHTLQLLQLRKQQIYTGYERISTASSPPPCPPLPLPKCLYQIKQSLVYNAVCHYCFQNGGEGDDTLFKAILLIAPSLLCSQEKEETKTSRNSQTTAVVSKKALERILDIYTNNNYYCSDTTNNKKENLLFLLQGTLGILPNKSFLSSLVVREKRKESHHSLLEFNIRGLFHTSRQMRLKCIGEILQLQSSSFISHHSTTKTTTISNYEVVAEIIDRCLLKKFHQRFCASSSKKNHTKEENSEVNPTSQKDIQNLYELLYSSCCSDENDDTKDTDTMISIQSTCCMQLADHITESSMSSSNDSPTPEKLAQILMTLFHKSFSLEEDSSSTVSLIRGCSFLFCALMEYSECARDYFYENIFFMAKNDVSKEEKDSSHLSYSGEEQQQSLSLSAFLLSLLFHSVLESSSCDSDDKNVITATITKRKIDEMTQYNILKGFFHLFVGRKIVEFIKSHQNDRKFVSSSCHAHEQDNNIDLLEQHVRSWFRFTFHCPKHDTPGRMQAVGVIEKAVSVSSSSLLYGLMQDAHLIYMKECLSLNNDMDDDSTSGATQQEYLLYHRLNPESIECEFRKNLEENNTSYDQQNNNDSSRTVMNSSSFTENILDFTTNMKLLGGEFTPKKKWFPPLLNKMMIATSSINTTVMNNSSEILKLEFLINSFLRLLSNMNFITLNTMPLPVQAQDEQKKKFIECILHLVKECTLMIKKRADDDGVDNILNPSRNIMSSSTNYIFILLLKFVLGLTKRHGGQQQEQHNFISSSFIDFNHHVHNHPSDHNGLRNELVYALGKEPFIVTAIVNQLVQQRSNSLNYYSFIILTQIMASLILSHESECECPSRKLLSIWADLSAKDNSCDSDAINRKGTTMTTVTVLEYVLSSLVQYIITTSSAYANNINSMSSTKLPVTTVTSNISNDTTVAPFLLKRALFLIRILIASVVHDNVEVPIGPGSVIFTYMMMTNNSSTRVDSGDRYHESNNSRRDDGSMNDSSFTWVIQLLLFLEKKKMENVANDENDRYSNNELIMIHCLGIIQDFYFSSSSENYRYHIKTKTTSRNCCLKKVILFAIKQLISTNDRDRDSNASYNQEENFAKYRLKYECLKLVARSMNASSYYYEYITTSVTNENNYSPAPNILLEIIFRFFPSPHQTEATNTFLSCPEKVFYFLGSAELLESFIVNTFFKAEKSSFPSSSHHHHHHHLDFMSFLNLLSSNKYWERLLNCCCCCCIPKIKKGGRSNSDEVLSSSHHLVLLINSAVSICLRIVTSILSLLNSKSNNEIYDIHVVILKEGMIKTDEKVLGVKTEIFQASIQSFLQNLSYVSALINGQQQDNKQTKDDNNININGDSNITTSNIIQSGLKCLAMKCLWITKLCILCHEDDGQQKRQKQQRNNDDTTFLSSVCSIFHLHHLLDDISSTRFLRNMNIILKYIHHRRRKRTTIRHEGNHPCYFSFIMESILNFLLHLFLPSYLHKLDNEQISKRDESKTLQKEELQCFGDTLLDCFLSNHESLISFLSYTEQEEITADSCSSFYHDEQSSILSDEIQNIVTLLCMILDFLIKKENNKEEGNTKRSNISSFCNQVFSKVMMITSQDLLHLEKLKQDSWEQQNRHQYNKHKRNDIIYSLLSLNFMILRSSISCDGIKIIPCETNNRQSSSSTSSLPPLYNVLMKGISAGISALKESSTRHCTIFHYDDEQYENNALLIVLENILGLIYNFCLSSPQQAKQYLCFTPSNNKKKKNNIGTKQGSIPLTTSTASSTSLIQKIMSIESEVTGTSIISNNIKDKRIIVENIRIKAISLQYKILQQLLLPDSSSSYSHHPPSTIQNRHMTTSPNTSNNALFFFKKKSMLSKIIKECNMLIADSKNKKKRTNTDNFTTSRTSDVKMNGRLGILVSATIDKDGRKLVFGDWDVVSYLMDDIIKISNRGKISATLTKNILLLFRNMCLDRSRRQVFLQKDHWIEFILKSCCSSYFHSHKYPKNNVNDTEVGSSTCSTIVVALEALKCLCYKYEKAVSMIQRSKQTMINKVLSLASDAEAEEDYYHDCDELLSPTLLLLRDLKQIFMKNGVR